MIYPYTIIEPKDINKVFKILKSFGYRPSFSIYRFKHRLISSTINVVINDYNEFGNFCFYGKGMMSNNIKRTYEKDIYKFLRLAAKYKNQNEY